MYDEISSHANGKSHNFRQSNRPVPLPARPVVRESTGPASFQAHDIGGDTMNAATSAERVTVHSLPLGGYTSEGAFYAKVDGKNVGEAGRALFETASDAMACGRRFVMRSEGHRD
jgi:hypothetical protein